LVLRDYLVGGNISVKLTKTVLVKLINEMMEHGGLSCGEAHPAHTHHEWEEHKREEDKKN